MSIQEMSVIEPPTSEGVKERAFEALKHGGRMAIVLASRQEVPRPEDMPITFMIYQTAALPKKGSMTIAGSNEEFGSIVLRTDPDPSQPASASLVARTPLQNE